MSTEKGRAGEERAARYLKRKGYELLDRNVRGGRGELDLVARKDDLLVFVEVKSHRNRESGLLAVHADKRERLHSAALAYLARFPQYSALQCRFDLIILTPKRGVIPIMGIEHIEDILR